MSSRILWDYWAKFYNRLWVQKWSLGPTREMIINYIQTMPKTKAELNILDMGCGTGQLLQELGVIFHNQSMHLTGVDYSRGMLKIARQENPDINFIHSDVLDFSVTERYDLIIASHTLPYYEDQATALRRMVDQLKPGGTLLVANASANNLYDQLCLLMIKITTGSAHYPSIQEMRAMVDQFMPDVSISTVKTAWFVPTIFFLIATVPGSDQ